MLLPGQHRESTRAVRRPGPRWMWLAVPDDTAQEILLGLLLGEHAYQIRLRLRRLAWAIWRRDVSGRPALGPTWSERKRRGWRTEPTGE